MSDKNVLVTGGSGYCGGVLIPRLLSENYKVTVYDTMFYGSQHLPKDNPNLNLINGDIRDIKNLKNSLEGHNNVIHLACISNDTSFELNEELSTSINLNAFEPMVVAAKEVGVKRFIYASSSSVYGVSDAPEVFEDHPLIPLTLYNKYKGLCEPILFNHTDENFTGVIFRPATVCGYSPRLRLDLSVNILTNLAINKGLITVFGGDQLRPNLHIQDYTDLCLNLLTVDKSAIQNQIFNCGYQNMTILEIAKAVKKVVEREFPEKPPINIEISPSNDKRSYHINSDKIKDKLNFVPKLSVENAILDLCEAFKNDLIPNSFEDDKYYNVRTMKKTKIS